MKLSHNRQSFIRNSLIPIFSVPFHRYLSEAHHTRKHNISWFKIENILQIFTKKPVFSEVENLHAGDSGDTELFSLKLGQQL